MSDEASGALRSALGGRYAFERELGRGGMATVWLAQDLRHDRPVAIKVLRPELGVILGAERFLREIRLTANLQHPHILPLLDSGEAGELLYYVMPYVEGESLRQRLQHEGQLPLDDALRLTGEVAEALDYAHQQGIVHRDIKPENILLSRGHALVADFGIALAVTQAGGGRLTETGLSLGTPAYMSPEQASASQVDGRSDVYALGCVLYEMLAGEPPYTGPTPQAILAKRVLEPVPHVRTLRESVPEAVELTITRALAKAPADRFASAGEFARALSVPVPAATTATTSPAFPARALWPTRRWAGLAALLLGLAVAGGLLTRARLGGKAASAGKPKMLAVLPFENLGRPEDEYFADGLSEEITSRLASVSDLGVISRTSTVQYKHSSKPLRQIGRELGADYVLEGSVRWDRQPSGRSRIRVTPQLIRVAEDRHVWSDRYDAELADVFRVQSDIAEQVTGALDVALGATERRAIATAPTHSLVAYDAYLRALALAASPVAGLDQEVRRAQAVVAQYREAVRLDSTFALAYAKLGQALVNLHGLNPELTPGGAEEARQALGQALRLDPDLAEAHLALARFYAEVKLDSVRAIAEFDVARRAKPNDADVLAGLAFVEFSLRGPTGRAVELAERAVTLDPASRQRLESLGVIYWWTLRFDEGERVSDRLIALDSLQPAPYVQKALIHLLRDGDTLAARAILRRAAGRVDSTALLRTVATMVDTPHAIAMLDEPFRRMLRALPVEAFGGYLAWYGLVKGYADLAQGDTAGMIAHYDTARRAAEATLRRDPTDGMSLIALSFYLGAVRRKAEAYRVIERARASAPVAARPLWSYIKAMNAAYLGDRQLALDELEHAVGRDPRFTSAWIRIDPAWIPLRGSPRFERLVAGKP